MSIGGVQGNPGINPIENRPSGPNALSGIETKGLTMGNLRETLIERMGPEEGEKYYKQFTTGMFTMMLTSMQKTADHALAEQKRQRREAGS